MGLKPEVLRSSSTKNILSKDPPPPPPMQGLPSAVIRVYVLGFKGLGFECLSFGISDLRT